MILKLHISKNLHMLINGRDGMVSELWWLLTLAGNGRSKSK